MKGTARHSPEKKNKKQKKGTRIFLYIELITYQCRDVVVIAEAVDAIVIAAAVAAVEVEAVIAVDIATVMGDGADTEAEGEPGDTPNPA